MSIENLPLLAHSGGALELHKRAGKLNLFVKIPITAERLPAIETASFVYVPINVTLLFSRGMRQSDERAHRNTS